MQHMNIPDPVLWFEGMPLLPHHFQQDFVYNQAISSFQMQTTGNFNYGVLELEIDVLSLMKNFFKVNKVFAIMPDGIVVKINNHPFHNLEYTLPNPETFEKNELSIYLTIPKLISDNYFLGKYPRYRKEQYDEIPDIYSGNEPTEVMKMVPNVGILSDIDINSSYVTLKIANLKIEKNLWSITSYLPATIKVTQENKIYQICSEIAFSIRKKIHHLSELIQSRSESAHISFISENLFYAQGLGIALPSLEGLLSSQQAHPFQIYLSLCYIFGGIGLLTNKLAPPSPISYQHEDLLTTFQRMRNEIDFVINSVIDEKISQDYLLKQENIYTIQIIKKHIFNGDIFFGFKKKSSDSETEFLSWIKKAIICEERKKDITIQNRTLGYQRQHLQRTEDIIPTRGVYLFKITIDEKIDDIYKIIIFNQDNLYAMPEEIFIFVRS